MLSRQEVDLIESENRKERIKWLSLACVDKGTLTALALTASAVLRHPTKERKDKLEKLIHKLHDKGIYSVETVIEKLKDIDYSM